MIWGYHYFWKHPHIHHIPGLEANQPAPRLLPVAHRQWNKQPAKKTQVSRSSNYQHLYHQATFLGDVWMVRLGTPTGVSKWMETIQNWRYTIAYLCSLKIVSNFTRSFGRRLRKSTCHMKKPPYRFWNGSLLHITLDVNVNSSIFGKAAFKDLFFKIMADVPGSISKFSPSDV